MRGLLFYSKPSVYFLPRDNREIPVFRECGSHRSQVTSHQAYVRAAHSVSQARICGGSPCDFLLCISRCSAGISAVLPKGGHQWAFVSLFLTYGSEDERRGCASQRAF